jgi:hypothetical protein
MAFLTISELDITFKERTSYEVQVVLSKKFSDFIEDIDLELPAVTAPLERLRDVIEVASLHPRRTRVDSSNIRLDIRTEKASDSLKEDIAACILRTARDAARFTVCDFATGGFRAA